MVLTILTNETVSKKLYYYLSVISIFTIYYNSIIPHCSSRSIPFYVSTPTRPSACCASRAAAALRHLPEGAAGHQGRGGR